MSLTAVTVLVPLGGVGSRFQNEGHFARPKPFVRVFGKEMVFWVLDNLSLKPEDSLVIAFNPSWMCMGTWMKEVILSKYPKAHLVHLPGPTRGAAETVLLALRGVPDTVRKNPVMICDGDTFYTTDTLSMYRPIARTHNASFVFHDTQPKPLYSYCRLDAQKFILETKEKVKISDWANSGCYCFRNGVELASECEAMLKEGETQLSQDKVAEYYTSGVISRMLAKGQPFQALEVKTATIHCTGTPAQLQEWCTARPPPQAQRFAFSFSALRRRSGSPVDDVVTFCKQLGEQGHIITVLTSAGTQHGDAAAWLDQQGIRFDELKVGADPDCDFLIRSDAIDPLLGCLQKQTGYYQGGPRGEGSGWGKPSRLPSTNLQATSFCMGLMMGVAIAAAMWRR